MCVACALHAIPFGAAVQGWTAYANSQVMPKRISESGTQIEVGTAMPASLHHYIYHACVTRFFFFFFSLCAIELSHGTCKATMILLGFQRVARQPIILRGGGSGGGKRRRND